MSSIADRIKFARKQLHLNQMDFSAMLGISQTHISKIESEKDNASDKVLRMISSEFNINFEWLKGGIGVMDAPSDNGRQPSDVALKIKKYLTDCNPIESDSCTLFLLKVPELFQRGSSRTVEYRDDITLQIFDLLENIVKLNKCLDDETKKIIESSDIKQKIDGAFWIRENYENRIKDNIKSLFRKFCINVFMQNN